MEEFSNYRREEAFDPFSVMLFKGLQVVTFLFFLAFLTINPEQLTGKVDTKAEFIITVSWPDSHPDDIDTYVEDPQGNVVWYHSLEAGLVNLDRDDRGNYRDTIIVNGQQVTNPLNQEIATIRGIVPGEYVVNIFHYLATSPDPVPINVKVEKVNPRVKVIFYDAFKLEGTGHEVTAVRFTVAADGSVTDVNQRPKSLTREVRKVRGGGGQQQLPVVGRP